MTWRKTYFSPSYRCLVAGTYITDCVSTCCRRQWVRYLLRMQERFKRKNDRDGRSSRDEMFHMLGGTRLQQRGREKNIHNVVQSLAPHQVCPSCLGSQQRASHVSKTSEGRGDSKVALEALRGCPTSFLVHLSKEI